MKKIILLTFSTIALLSCNKIDDDSKQEFSKSEQNDLVTPDLMSYSYVDLKKVFYQYAQSNWQENIDQLERSFFEAQSKGLFSDENSINDKIVDIEIQYNFNFSKEVSVVLSNLYSSIFNTEIKTLKEVFDTEKSKFINNKDLTLRDYEVLNPIFASFEANIDFLLLQYNFTKNENPRKSLFGSNPKYTSWLDCMTQKGGAPIARGLVEGAIGGAIGGAIAGAGGGTVAVPIIGTTVGAVGGAVFVGAAGASTGMLGGFLWASVDCFTQTQGGSGSGNCVLLGTIDPIDPRYKGMNYPKVIRSQMSPSQEEIILSEIQNSLRDLQRVSLNSKVRITIK
ncbi:hypothetical protein [Myroides sp. WP-1]|uniref:hypothetical protein n=1 Tax=Myroides sp. WP-1 TaxID=2759944 RepID=UPI0015FD00C8|nr:hypothetical protein [Myroides sp. WP-1]MBB1139269.1 hypothetical protein [Myroides sp. WP-1]